MYSQIEIETFEEKGKKYVYLSNDGSSGCKYTYKTDKELKKIVADYAESVVDYYLNYREE